MRESPHTIATHIAPTVGHRNPGSIIVQSAEHPSPSLVFPSSHASTASRTRSPQSNETIPPDPPSPPTPPLPPGSDEPESPEQPDR